MRVLITGATGFLGSHLTGALLREGADVIVLRRHQSRLDRLSHFADRVEFHTISDDLAPVFRRSGQCDAVIHAATCYGRDGESWGYINEVNVGFPLRLLENAIKCGIGIFLNIGTALNPAVSAYALSKHQFSNWGRMVATHSNSLSFINARLEHFYGYGNSTRNFITALIRQCLADLPRIPLTMGGQVRDFIHVDDAVAAVIHLLDAARTGRIARGASDFDVGSGCPTTLRSVAELVRKLCNSRTTLDFGAVPYRVNECMESTADTAPLKSLGWTCRIALEEGLISTIAAERRR